MSNDSSLSRAVHWPALSAQEVTSAGISRGNTTQRPGWANKSDWREGDQPSFLGNWTQTGLCKVSMHGNGWLNRMLVTFCRGQEQLCMVFQAKACSRQDGFQAKHGLLLISLIYSYSCIIVLTFHMTRCCITGPRRSPKQTVHKEQVSG